MHKRILILLLLAIALPSGISAADYGPAIYGNANLDNVIDENDITYVNNVIIGTAKPTELADANLDDEIDEQDIQQIEQIINQSE